MFVITRWPKSDRIKLQFFFVLAWVWLLLETVVKQVIYCFTYFYRCFSSFPNCVYGCKPRIYRVATWGYVIEDVHRHVMVCRLVQPDEHNGGTIAKCAIVAQSTDRGRSCWKHNKYALCSSTCVEEGGSACECTLSHATYRVSFATVCCMALRQRVIVIAAFVWWLPIHITPQRMRASLVFTKNSIGTCRTIVW